MIAITLAATLVTLSFNGQVDLKRNLTDNECVEARSVALYGKSVKEKADDDKVTAEAQAKWEADQATAQTKWEAENPKTAAKCAAAHMLCGPKFSIYDGWQLPAGVSIVGDGFYNTTAVVTPYKYAECVQP